jgi:hypothetical protein
VSRVPAQEAALDADRFDRLAKSLGLSETCFSRVADRPRLSPIACAALGRRHALKLGIGVVLGGALRVLGAADAAKAATVNDAKCPVPGGVASGFGRNRFAQTFKAKHTGLLTQATVQLSGGSAGGATNSFLIEIRKTSRKGKPTSTVLASFSTPLMERPSSGETTPVVATFSPGASVRKDKRYALVLRQQAGSPSVQTNLEGCGGTLFEDDDLDNIFVKTPAGGDMVFATVVTT